ncbi:TRAP transporter large permease subunit [Roseobacter sp. HKCCD9010]|uniref:TRAP transporter large permease n=1 Tax=unclassified Roseobacter TaxID=196798 RepID=UPI0014912EB4|nr:MULTISPECIES: TRAP transporter large permease subunit [unclassified Roseobacter]MBF9052417.1 TRAP transporter large permease subunit [Rhodobacterales bacterium HKCCD4356]NNV14191.1 TRAP transporter large permease subunit [Roseobacter sp. HKCCD7357]NNV18584.1 TRAP transporter large permease subunit [Roseobacter sp. HKCCD8768]NNV28022.1 TRAP transporter large permease subunit [Roseobacter sp. HKCCD8192]NNV32257.1 TRAP transporter large permease subunit [Roseobacter sp. HKCCD9061]
MTAPLLWVFFLLLALSVPVAHAMLGGAAFALWLDGKPMAVLAQRLYTPTQSFPMLAIPFFILAGNLMMSGRFGEYLVNIARLLVGRFKGGMGQVSVLGSVMFGGVSGSAVADATALGNALIPVQKKAGYPAGFAAAINSSSSTISVLIPPSIPLILYGLISNTSVIELFVAGILPGLMLGIGMFTMVWIIARLRNLPRAPLEGGFAAFKSQVYAAIPAMLMPIFVIGTLRFGIATPTEVSVMAVAYALLVSGFLYRDLSVKTLWRASVDTAAMTGAVMIIIMASSTIQWVLTAERVPQDLAAWVAASISDPWMVIIALNLVMLVVGAFLDLPAAVLLLGPIFVTIANAIGLDPVQLGLMMVVNLSIGLYTPPVGTTLFISSSIAKVGIGEAVKALLPFYLVALTVLALISFVPSLTIY